MTVVTGIKEIVADLLIYDYRNQLSEKVSRVVI